MERIPDPAPDDVPAEELQATLRERQRRADIAAELERRRQFDEQYGPYDAKDLPDDLEDHEFPELESGQ